MFDLKKPFLVDLFTLRFVFLYFVLFVFMTKAQQVVNSIESTESINLSIPLKLCFQKQDKDISSVGFASDKNNSLFIPFRGGKITKTILSSSPLIWTSDLGGEISSNLIFDNGKVYLITKVFEEVSKKKTDDSKQLINHTLWSLDAETGLTDWQLGFASNASVSLNIYQDKIFLIAKNGTINWIKKNDPQKISKKYSAQVISSPPSFFEDKIYIGTEDNSILVISIDKTEIVSKIPTLQSPASILIAFEGKLFWGERKGFVNLFDMSSNNLLWSVRYGGEISSLTLVSNGILVTSLDNFVYFTSLQKGKKVWRRRLAGRISEKPLIAGNFAVLVTAIDNKAVVLDLRNGRIVNQISLVDIGFILSKPMILQKSLVFLTNKGIFSFVTTNINCSQN